MFIGRHGDCIAMDFPAYGLAEIPVTEDMEKGLGARPAEAYVDRDLLLVFEDEETVRSMKPDFGKVSKLDGLNVAVTAPGEEYDCVSRFFAPKLEVDEDPVTGSAHCMIAPYWGRRLGKEAIDAYQASARGGEMVCELHGERVVLLGKAALFSIAELNL